MTLKTDTSRGRYFVTADKHLATFRDLNDAIEYARFVSKKRRLYVEVGRPATRELYAQFEEGAPTPEFKHLNAA